MWDEFIRVFSQYSPVHLVITDIFGAFEDVQSNCSPQKMAKELSEKGISCIYVSFEKLYEYAITLSAHSSEDIIMTLGAGKLDLLALQLCSYNDINNNNNNNSIKTNVIL